jgi:hypothetical protein
MANFYRAKLEGVRLKVKQETKAASTYRFFEIKFFGAPWRKVFIGHCYSLGFEDSEKLKADYLCRCGHCGCQCFAGSLRGRSMYCSRKCSRAAHKALQPKPKPKRKSIRCEHCGHWFLPARSTAKFCSARCRVAANRAKSAKTKTTKKRRVRAK